MGWYIDGFDFEFFLWMGMMFVVFYWFGKIFWLKESWNSKENGFVSFVLYFFKFLVGMFLGLEVLLGCRFCFFNFVGCCKWIVWGELICIIKLIFGSKSLIEFLSFFFCCGVNMMLWCKYDVIIFFLMFLLCDVFYDF